MSLTPELASNPIVAKLRTIHPDAVEGGGLFSDELTLFLSPEKLREVCRSLREDPELQFNFFTDLTAVDRYPAEPRFEVVVHLYSIPRAWRLRLKVRVLGDEPCADSLVPLATGKSRHRE